mgnify:CR=1 FL=1
MKDYWILIGILAIGVFVVFVGLANYSPKLASKQVSATIVNPNLPQRIGPVEAYPNFQLNPGKLSSLDPNKTCLDPNWRTSSVRPPVSYTNALKKQDITLYHYADTNMADYELDHIVSLEVCGDPKDPTNLWPQLYNLIWNGKDIGAKVKDKVENLMAKMVKARQLTIQEAADNLRFDWVNVGMKYGIIK